MALDDILQAITAHADRELADARTAHERRMTQMRETARAAGERARAEITAQKEQKLKHLRQKAEAYASTQVRHASLLAKKRVLDDVYASVAEALAALPEKKVEPLLAACIRALPAEGEIRPAKAHAAALKKLAGPSHAIGEPIDAAGGFVFTSKDRDVDCTFDVLVERVLRPDTELDVSSSLFA